MNGLIIDCFAGGGGASVGIEMALGRSVDIAVNHNPQAILMHKTNHPDTLHLTEDIFKVDLQRYVKGRTVDLMWASPDCTSHSKAKGGKPREKGLRILPWAVYKHARQILPNVIIMENVEEIQQWGPLDEHGHPIPERRGEDYNRFITAMKGLGYVFDSRELVAADYGAPTIRKRWYGIFRRDGKEIVWPEPTHSKEGVNGLEPWEPIWKYLDLDDFGKSIFNRKKPLAKNTMNRIARGLEKFVFNCPEPFIVPIGYGEREGQKPRVNSIHNPLGTIVASGRKHYLCSPLLIQYHSETSKTGVRGQAVTDPLMTIDTSNRYGLVMSHLTKFYKSGCGQSMYDPIHTITTSPGHFGTVSVLAVPAEQLMAGLDKSIKEQNDVNDIIQKCTCVSQFIIEYYGSGIGQDLNSPIHTIVTKDRFALITVLGNEYVILDICLRMLKAEELKLGQGFPKDYIIDRDYRWRKYPVSEQVARIGNSVVPVTAQTLVEANCGYLKVGERARNLILESDSGGQLKFA